MLGFDGPLVRHPVRRATSQRLDPSLMMMTVTLTSYGGSSTYAASADG